MQGYSRIHWKLTALGYEWFLKMSFRIIMHSTNEINIKSWFRYTLNSMWKNRNVLSPNGSMLFSCQVVSHMTDLGSLLPNRGLVLISVVQHLTRYTNVMIWTSGPLLLFHGVTLILTWIIYYMYCYVWDEITYSFPNRWSLRTDM